MSKKQPDAEVEAQGDIGGAIESTEKLERIREIVFGAQIRDYAQRFENLNRDIGRLQHEISRLTEQVSEQNRLLSERLGAENAQVLAQLQEQSRQFGQQVQDLDSRQGAQMRDLDERLSKQIQDLDQRQTTRLQDIDTKYGQRGDELQRILHESEESIRIDLRQNAEALGDAKTDRVSLGDMLVQMGNSLKDGQATGLAGTLLQELINEIE